MKRINLFLLMAVLALGSMSCSMLSNLLDDSEPTSYDESYYNETEEPATEAPFDQEQPSAGSDAFCPNITGQIIDAASTIPEEESTSTKGVRDDDEISYLVTYSIENDELIDPFYEDAPADMTSEQEDTAKHEEIWNYFAALIPVEDREAISEFSITTDGEGNTLASVMQTRNDPAYWALEVDILDTGNMYDLTYTLVHEYGHVLTLGPDQVVPSLAVFNNPEDNDIYLQELSACRNYFPGEGCANSDSYINAFEEQFWADIYDEWNEVNLEEDSNVYYEKLDEFYAKYEDRFVNDYAATNPEEDIAESWATFVLGPKPEGDSIADEKIQFFYQYPELVQLRERILSNLCSSFPQ
jgi:hypothetical protein